MLPPLISPGQMADELVAPSYVIVYGNATAATQSYTVPAGKVFAVHAILMYAHSSSVASFFSIGGVNLMHSPATSGQLIHVADRHRMGIGLAGSTATPTPISNTAPTSAPALGYNMISVAENAPFLFLAAAGQVVAASNSAGNAALGFWGTLHDV
ncbi:hypothetical protein D3C72_852600 [compost metagenome]